jgi:hypothetical protein
MERYPDRHQFNQFLVIKKAENDTNKDPIWTTELLINQSYSFKSQPIGIFAPSLVVFNQSNSDPDLKNYLTILGKELKLAGEDRQQATGNRQQRSFNTSSYDLVKYQAPIPLSFVETSLTFEDRELDQQIAALVNAPLHSIIKVESQANLTILQQKNQINYRQLQQKLETFLEIIYFLVKKGTLKALKTVAFILFGTVIVTWLFHQESAPVAQESEPKSVPQQPEQEIVPQPKKKPLTVEPVKILPPQPIEKTPEFAQPPKPPQKIEKPPLATPVSQTQPVIVDRYYIPQNSGSTQTTPSQPIVVERYYIPTTVPQHQPPNPTAIAQIPTIPVAVTPTPTAIETSYLPQDHQEPNVPIQGKINPEQPVSRAAIARVQPSTPEINNPAIDGLPPSTPEKSYLLTGIMGFEENSVALFQSGEETIRVYLGEQLSFANWKLVDIIDGKALLQKGNSIISLRVGETFNPNLSL